MTMSIFNTFYTRTKGSHRNVPLTHNSLPFKVIKQLYEVSKIVVWVKINMFVA